MLSRFFLDLGYKVEKEMIRRFLNTQNIFSTKKEAYKAISKEFNTTIVYVRYLINAATH